MILERIETPNLALFSYFLAQEEDAVVIDPRRDVDVYLELARKHNKNIRYILETHRHEDFVLGSIELAERTGAEILRSGHEEFDYTSGRYIMDGDVVSFGGLELRALHTPGHTLGHLTYVLYRGESPYVAFTGDALFYGDVGRTDFYGADQYEKIAGLAYESLHEKLLPLGDGVIVMPAHGAGSACGANIVDIPYSTIGQEKANSPVFKPETKEAFVDKFAGPHFYPPYFAYMEEVNVSGAPFVGDIMSLHPLTKTDLFDTIEGKTLVDVRAIGNFSYHHLPGALYMGDGMLAKALGAFVPVNDDIILVTDGLSDDAVRSAYWTLRRMGYDAIHGCVGDAMHITLEAEGVILEEQTALTHEDFLEMWEEMELTNLDVRDPEEIGPVTTEFDRKNIPLEQLPDHLDEVEALNYVSSCVTGIRALVGASYLRSKQLEGAHVRGNLKPLEKKEED